jgi:hypothetical protein
MRGVGVPGNVLRTAAVVAGAGLLVAGGAWMAGARDEPVPYVAEYGIGWDTPEEREYVLTPTAAPDEPPSLDPSFEPSVAWVDDGRYLGVVTYGSSSCPSGPHGIDVVADQEIAISLGPLFPDQNVCTADISAHVTVVELPAGVTPTEPLVARFDGVQVTIPAVGG